MSVKGIKTQEQAKEKFMKRFISEKKKKRIFDIIQIGRQEDFVSRVFDIFIVLVIFANIAVLFMETFEGLIKYSDVLHIVEIVTMVVFAIEYLLRIWTAEYLYPDKTRKGARLRFLFRLTALWIYVRYCHFSFCRDLLPSGCFG